MNTNEKNIAIQEIRDIQDQIEQFEAEWIKANNKGDREATNRADRRIELLLSMRRGMEMMLTALNVEFDRKEDILIDRDGKETYHTRWYLV